MGLVAGSLAGTLEGRTLFNQQPNSAVREDCASSSSSSFVVVLSLRINWSCVCFLRGCLVMSVMGKDCVKIGD